jgi:hypothetical protein
MMETKIEEIAAVLRSTDNMAEGFAERVQERVGQPVSHAEILAVLEGISPPRITMDRVVSKLRSQLHLE